MHLKEPRSWNILQSAIRKMVSEKKLRTLRKIQIFKKHWLSIPLTVYKAARTSQWKFSRMLLTWKRYSNVADYCLLFFMRGLKTEAWRINRSAGSQLKIIYYETIHNQVISKFALVTINLTNQTSFFLYQLSDAVRSVYPFIWISIPKNFQYSAVEIRIQKTIFKP